MLDDVDGRLNLTLQVVTRLKNSFKKVFKTVIRAIFACQKRRVGMRDDLRPRLEGATAYLELSRNLRNPDGLKHQDEELLHGQNLNGPRQGA